MQSFFKILVMSLIALATVAHFTLQAQQKISDYETGFQLIAGGGIQAQPFFETGAALSRFNSSFKSGDFIHLSFPDNLQSFALTFSQANNPGEGERLYGFHAGYTCQWFSAPVGVGLRTSYLHNGKNTEAWRLQPEAGIHLFSLVNLWYGYSIALGENRQPAWGRHHVRLTVSFNILGY